MRKRGSWFKEVSGDELSRRIITSKEELKKATKHILTKKAFAYDTETDGKETMTMKVEAISVACDDFSFVVPTKWSNLKDQNIIVKELILNAVNTRRDLIENSDKPVKSKADLIDNLATCEEIAASDPSRAVDYLLGIKNQKVRLKKSEYNSIQRRLLRPEDDDWIPRTDLITNEEALEIMKPLFESKTITKIGHNLDFDMHAVANHGTKVEGPYFDTMIAAWFISGTALQGKKSLKFRSLQDLGVLMAEYKDIDWKDFDNFMRYSLLDAIVTYELYVKYANAINSMSERSRSYFGMEMNLIPIIHDMERTGILLDVDGIEVLYERAKKRLDQIEEYIWIICGEQFNIASTMQKSEILYKKLGVDVLGYTGKNKQPSTDEKTMSKLVDQYYPLVGDDIKDLGSVNKDIVLDNIDISKLTDLTYGLPILPCLLIMHSKDSKLINAFFSKLPGHADENGRIHCNIRQTGTITGRWSMSDPNLQQIPAKDIYKIRQSFIARKGYKFVSADLSQAELRMLAWFSDDEVLIDAYNTDKDIHNVTAAGVNNVKIEDVTDEMRAAAKTINFGIIYGMAAGKLSETLKITKQKAQAYIDAYFESYPGVKQHIDNRKAEAHSSKQVFTLLGKHCVLENMVENLSLKQKAHDERCAINYPIQGSVSDWMKAVLIRLYNDFSMAEDDVHVLLQVHDELILEVPEDKAESWKDILSSVMQMPFSPAIEIPVPFRADANISDYWVKG